MDKKLSSLLSVFSFEALAADGKTPLDLNLIGNTPISDIVFDSRLVVPGAIFFALPGIHTDGNKFIASSIEKGANVIIYQGQIDHEEQVKIAKAVVQRQLNQVENTEVFLPVFLKVDDARTCMAPVSDAFYNSPSKKLIVIGVTGTEGKSSTVSFVWQLLRLAGYKAGFVSTVQYSLGDEALANPQHTTTPEAPIVQKHLYDMVQNGCQFAVIESSSHGLSKKLNRLGNVCFDCGLFMNVTLEHLEFHKTFDQYKNDKANLFRALDEHDHVKIINNIKQTVPSFAVVNLEDLEATYFASQTTKKVIGFTTNGVAGRGTVLKKVENIPIVEAKDLVSSKNSISFTFESATDRTSEIKETGNSNKIKINAPLPGAFNAYNIMAAMIAVSGLTGKTFEELSKCVSYLKPITGRMTTIEKGQPFEVIIDYAHTPSSFETIFPPLKNRCEGKIFALFGSGGERDVTKRPLQGEIAGKYCDVVILSDEDPRGEDPVLLLEDIAVGVRKAGKIDNQDLFIIPDRPTAIRKAFSMAKKGDIVLLLGKGHENSIIYKDYVMPYDEILEAEKALSEINFL